MSDPFRPVLPISTPTIDVMVNHRSVRSYTKTPVPDADIQAILTAAISAPTSSNQNLWSVIEVRDPERKTTLMELTGSNPFIAQAPVFLVFVADYSRLARLSERSQRPAEALRYQEALLTATVDAALAAQNATVAAESLGYGTCYVGGIRSHIQEVCDLLDLPQFTYPVVGLVIGEPKDPGEAGIKPRLPLAGVHFRERYDKEDADAAVEALELENLRYFTEIYGKTSSWKAKMLRRIEAASSLGTRAGNREVLAKRGFLDQ